MAREQWPDLQRRRALQLLSENGGDLRAAVRSFGQEHERPLPLDTLRRWSERSSDPTMAPSVDGLAMRLLRLCSSEVTRLERSETKTDLERAGKVAQILKTIEPLTRSKARAGRTLADLNTSDPQTHGETTQSQGAAAQTLTTDGDLSDLSV